MNVSSVMSEGRTVFEEFVSSVFSAALENLLKGTVENTAREKDRGKHKTIQQHRRRQYHLRRNKIFLKHWRLHKRVMSRALNPRLQDNDKLRRSRLVVWCDYRLCGLQV